MAGEAVELVINNRDQLRQCALVSIAPGVQESADIVWGGFTGLCDAVHNSRQIAVLSDPSITDCAPDRGGGNMKSIVSSVVISAGALAVAAACLLVTGRADAA